MTLLREGLLRGTPVVLTGSPSAIVRSSLEALGASLEEPHEGVRALVHDASASFQEEGLLAALEQAWSAVATVAGGMLIPDGQGGKIVLVAPRAGAAAQAEAARCALENLARTLSVEWARYGITCTVLTPAAATSDRDLATLLAYLLSSAGDYFSGCRFELK